MRSSRGRFEAFYSTRICARLKSDQPNFGMEIRPFNSTARTPSPPADSPGMAQFVFPGLADQLRLVRAGEATCVRPSEWVAVPVLVVGQPVDEMVGPAVDEQVDSGGELLP